MSEAELDDLTAAAAASLCELKEEFRPTLLADICKLRSAIEVTSGDSKDGDDGLVLVRRIAHDIKGYAPSVGFEAAGQAAATLEGRLREAEGGVSLTPEVLIDLVEALSLAVDDTSPGEEPAPDSDGSRAPAADQTID